MNRLILALMCLFLISGLTGCGSYYKVTEPTTGKIYYTEDIDKTKSGTIRFQDAVTGSNVTIQNSEVQEITKDEFKVNTLSHKSE